VVILDVRDARAWIETSARLKGGGTSFPLRIDNDFRAPARSGYGAQGRAGIIP